MTPEELQAQAYDELLKGRAAMALVVEAIQQRLTAGEHLSKAETRAFNRACQSLRYAADCAHRSKPRERKRWQETALARSKLWFEQPKAEVVKRPRRGKP